MARIIFHNLSTAYATYTEDHRSFLNNGLLIAETGDLVLVHKKPTDEYLQFLSVVGVLPVDVKLLEFDPYKDLNNLEVEENKYKSLEPFNCSKIEIELAKKLKLPLRYNITVADSLESKINFRELVQKLGLQTPESHLLGNGWWADRLMCLKMLIKFNKILIRYDLGSGGLNTYTTNILSFLGRLLSGRSLNPKEDILFPNKEQKLTIDRWYSDVKYRIGLYYRIDESGSFKHIVTHEVIVDESGYRETGSRSHHFIPTTVLEEVEKQAEKLIIKITELGYHGFISFDCLYLHDASVVWLETNPRFGAGVYSYYIAKKTGVLAANKPYRAINYRHRSFLNRDETHMLDFFKDKLFNPDKMIGLIPYYFRFKNTPVCRVFEVMD